MIRHLATRVVRQIQQTASTTTSSHPTPPHRPPLPDPRERCHIIEDHYYASTGSLDDTLRALHLSRSKYNLLLFEAGGLSPPDE